MSLDIHDYDVKYRQAEEQVRASDISDRNKALIFGYCTACITANVCGRVRLIRVMGGLLMFARRLNKNFDVLTREDVSRVVQELMTRQPAYSPETLGTYKAILKRFMTWVVQPDTFPDGSPPPIVSWLTGHVRNKDKVRLTRNELLTPQEIQRVLTTCTHPRDRALISVLWETGGRIAEIGNLQLRHISTAEHGYLLDVNGKTGQRTPIIVSSAPALTAWLNQHPFRDNQDAPLWVHATTTTTPRQLKYDSIRSVLLSHFAMSGITKRVYPHLFRHSRATYVLANGLMTEAQAKKYFGWTPNSDQLATYSHLVDADANNAILRENNLAPRAMVQDDLKAQTCHQCGTVNSPDARYCTTCNAILDLKTAYEHQQVHDLKEQLFTNMFKLLVNKGMVDEAAREIHDAQLGGVLKQLAQAAKDTPTESRVANIAPDQTIMRGGN